MSAVTPSVTFVTLVTLVTSVAVTAAAIFRDSQKKLKPSEFRKLRLRVALSVDACAELCGVTVCTGNSDLVACLRIEG